MQIFKRRSTRATLVVFVAISMVMPQVAVTFLSGPGSGFSVTSRSTAVHAEEQYEGLELGLGADDAPEVNTGKHKGPKCGNGSIEFGESCDEGSHNGEPNHCNSSCTGITAPICGNAVQELGEACDDGNYDDADSCTNICTRPALCENPIVIGFEEHAPGSWLTDEYTALGVTISADNHGAGPDKTVVFDSNLSAHPSDDLDLGTPNQVYGGPGVGWGANAGFGNTESLNNIVIVATNETDTNHDGLIDVPDDENAGGTINVHFASPVIFDHGVLIDIEESGGSIEGFDASASSVFSVSVPGVGDNSVQRVYPAGVFEVNSISVNIPGSGGFDELAFCPVYVPACGNGTLDDGEQCDDGNASDGDGCTAQCTEEPLAIYATKVVCDDESDLPNWGQGAPTIDADTAQLYVDASNGRCRLEPYWSFQWGFGDQTNTEGVDKVPGDHVGEADGTDTSGDCDMPYCGPNTYTGTAYNEWKTFGPTDSNGVASVEIHNLEDAPLIWVRENLKDGFIPFTYPPSSEIEDDVTAELYCSNDVYNYDNYDYVSNPQRGETRYCVAFNAPIPVIEPDPARICGVKFHDENKNGQQDQGENNLAGWTVKLFSVTSGQGSTPGGSTDDSQDTDKPNKHLQIATVPSAGSVLELIDTVETTEDGYCFNDLAPGQYFLSEVNQGGWTPVVSNCTVSVDAGETQTCDFANAEEPVVEPEVGEYVLAKNRTTGGELHAGDTVAFDLILTNSGAVGISNAVLTDRYDPDILSFASADLAPNSTSTDALVWNDLPVDTLVPGESWTIQVTFTVNDVSPTTTINYLDARAVQDSNGNDLPDSTAQASLSIIEEPDTPPGGGTTTTTTSGGGGGGGYITPDPRITIDKTVDKTLVEPGDVVTYTVVIRNVGNAVGLDLVLDDTLPSGFTFSGSGGTTKHWSLPPIGPGSMQTVTYSVVVGDGVVSGVHDNLAVASISNGNTAQDSESVEAVSPIVLGETFPEPEFTELPDTGGSNVGLLLLVLTALFAVTSAVSFAVLVKKSHAGLSLQ